MRQKLARAVTLAGLFVLAVCVASATAQQVSKSTESRPFEVISVDGNQVVARTAAGTKDTRFPRTSGST